MATYREALFHMRAGGTARCSDKTVRFLTPEEATPIILEQSPSRAVRIDEETGKPLVDKKTKRVIVDVYADTSRVQRLGLYDIGGSTPTQFRPTDEDIVGAWILVGVGPLAEEIVPGDETVEESIDALSESLND